MKLKSKQTQQIALATLLGLASTAATSASSEVSFEFELQQTEIELDNNRTLDTDAIGLHYIESYTETPLTLELQLGYAGSDVHNDTSMQGINPNGSYLGLTAHIQSPRHYRIHAGVSFSYRYHSFDFASDTQKAELNFNQREARAWLSADITDRLQLSACAIAADINGDIVLTGTTNSTTSFSNKERNGYCGNIRYYLDSSGYVSYEQTGGFQEGGRIIFGRHF